MSAIVGCGMKCDEMWNEEMWKVEDQVICMLHSSAILLSFCPYYYYHSCILQLSILERHSAMSLQPQISIHYTTIPSPLPSSPSFNFHLTCMANTLMIWVGTGLPTDAAGDTTGGAAFMGSVEQVDNKLTADWSVAMPSRGVGLVSALNCGVQKR